MPTWLSAALALAGPLATTAESVAKIVEAAIAEYESSDTVAAKATSIVNDVVAAGGAVEKAVTTTMPAA